jgi:hypothetical protein
MLNRFNWSSYWRPDEGSPWLFIAHGATYGEANAAVVLGTTGGETAILFGRQLPPGRIHTSYRSPDTRGHDAKTT